MLTSGGGLAGIDVADNDHVDVHLLLTAEEIEVSGLFTAIEFDLPWCWVDGRLMEVVDAELDSPHDCGIESCRFMCVFCCFALEESLESVAEDISDGPRCETGRSKTYCTE